MADTIYSQTLEGWLYVAVVSRLSNRAIVSWATADYLRVMLVASAMQMVLGRHTPDDDLLYHSDQGSYCTSCRVQVLLQMLGRLVRVQVNAGAIEKRRVRG